MRLSVYHLALPCLLLTLAACGDDPDRKAAKPGAEGAESGLPAPDAGAGSITGMPDRPGPGPVGENVQREGDSIPADLPIDNDEVLSGESYGPAGGRAPSADDGTPSAPGEPTVQDAVAVVREYYAALDAHRYGPAYALWSDGGNATGQTPQQFADGFAETDKVSVQIGQPGPVDAGAGGRWIQVPVSITAIHRDGSEHRYVGSFTLRRTVVDGASPEQRAWRIASADLRELQL